MKKFVKPIAAPLCVAMLAIASPAIAANNVEDVGASERVNFSGKLRMLSQRIPAAACNLADGVSPDLAQKVLQGASAEFDKIVNALEFGDESLNIRGVEERRKTLVALRELRDRWAVMHEAAETVDVNDSNAAMPVIAAQNMNVLDAAKLLVSELSGQYSDPAAMLQADAMLVDISGRQRMLTQKISKESCFIWSGKGDADTQKALAKTMQLFEASLIALRDGLAAAGVKPAPTPEIESGLQAIYDDWLEVKPVLAGASSGVMADTATREDTFARLNTLLKDMNAVVGLYTAYAKTDL